MSDNSLHAKIVVSMKAAAWERAKGELRAMVALAGSNHGGTLDEFGRYQFQYIEDEVDAFIAAIEDKELHL